MTAEYLYNKYPKILSKVGFEHDDGWFWLIDQLCSQLQFDIDKNGQPQVEAVQVKEKFGSLRFYVSGATERQHGMISLVESMSYEVCECCGTTKEIGHTKGWVKTICKNCLDDKDVERWKPAIFDENIDAD